MKINYSTLHIDGVTISTGNAKLGLCYSHSLNNIFCNPEWPCYEKCYARAMANYRASVRTSYDRNTDILINDRDRFFRAVNTAMTMAEAQGIPYRIHVDGECPDQDYVDRTMDAILAHPNLVVIFMTKRHDLINNWIERKGFDSLPEVLPRLSTWAGMETDNPYGLPESGFIPKGEEVAGRLVCPNQLAKENGNEWHCTDCTRCKCGCACNKDINFKEHR